MSIENSIAALVTLWQQKRLSTSDMATFAELVGKSFYPKMESDRAITLAYQVALSGPQGVKDERLARLCGLKAQLGDLSGARPGFNFESKFAQLLAWSMIANASGKCEDLQTVHKLMVQLPPQVSTEIQHEVYRNLVEAEAKRGREHWNFAGIGASTIPDTSPWRSRAYNALFRVTRQDQDDKSAEVAILRLIKNSGNNTELLFQGVSELVELIWIHNGLEGGMRRVDELVKIILPFLDVGKLHNERRVKILLSLFEATGDRKYSEACGAIVNQGGVDGLAATEAKCRLVLAGYGHAGIETNLRLKEFEAKLGNDYFPWERAELIMTGIECRVIAPTDVHKAWRKALAHLEEKDEEDFRFHRLCRLARLAHKMEKVSVFPVVSGS